LIVGAETAIEDEDALNGSYDDAASTWVRQYTTSRLKAATTSTPAEEGTK
jgi:hypothetical protein